MTRVEYPARFDTTRWSVVKAATGARSPTSTEAAAELCRAYWGPVYVYVRRRGWSPQDAEDITQEFLARLLVDGDRLAGVTMAGGRFRSYLIACLKRHLSNHHAHRSAAKRGGGRAVLSLQARDAEERLLHEPADAQLTPDRAFDRRWAVTLLGRALSALEAEYVARGRGAWFGHMKVYLAADRSAPPHAETAARLGMSEAAVKVAAHRLRTAFRDRLERELFATVAQGADLGEEIDDLFRALS